MIIPDYVYVSSVFDDIDEREREPGRHLQQSETQASDYRPAWPGWFEDRLAASGHKTSLHNRCGPTVVQTRCGQVGPDLLVTVLSKNPDGQPISLRQRNILTGVRLGSKPR